MNTERSSVSSIPRHVPGDSSYGRARALPASAIPAAGNRHALRTLAKVLVFGVVATILALIFAPWQQSVRGQGRVIAYAPVERQQEIDAPIDGRVTRWFVQEGDRVEEGQLIAELADNDPQILDRLRRERNAAQAQVDAATLSITLTEGKIASLRVARESAIDNAKLRIQMALDRRDAAERRVDADRAALATSRSNLERLRQLHARGLSSKRDLELGELETQTLENELSRAEAASSAAKSEVRALEAERSEVGALNQASIESAQASLEKLRADKAGAEAEVAKVEVRLARQQQMEILAPRSGTILRVLAKQGTEMVSQGEHLAVLVPDAGATAVELYVDGNDVPLITEGRAVRLQFEGWPAVQFVGWPSVAVGTFPGRVAFVDAHGDGSGRFRVVVVPETPDAWPEGRWLRQGGRANGWILLNQVSLGFELWRQFNGFPQALPDPPSVDGAGQAKSGESKAGKSK